LKSKDEVFGKFNEFKALIDNLSERKIKILRSYNGGEYTSKEFEIFFRYVGIKRELTTSYNPQQNGVEERKNRTIMEDCSTTQVFQQRTNTFSNHSHNQIKDQHTDVFTW
jgi:transposase InsO family protein